MRYGANSLCKSPVSVKVPGNFIVIKKISLAIRGGSVRKNRILLTLAMGSAKMCIALQMSRRLLQSRWSLQATKKPSNTKKRSRILFLADRNVLTKQAVNDFSAFGEDAVVRITPVK